MQLKNGKQKRKPISWRESLDLGGVALAMVLCLVPSSFQGEDGIYNVTENDDDI